MSKNRWWGPVGLGSLLMAALVTGCPGGVPIDADGVGGLGGSGHAGSPGVGGGLGGELTTGGTDSVTTGGSSTGGGSAGGSAGGSGGAEGPCGGSAEPTLVYADVDQDGFGDPATGETGCPGAAGKVDNDEDCNDQVYGCQLDCSACLSDGFIAAAEEFDFVAGSGFGQAIAALGDVDENGFPDFAIGSPLANRVTIHFTGPGGSTIDTSSVVGAGAFGTSLAAIGDLDGDGTMDLAVGSPNEHYATNNAACESTDCPVGRVRIYFLSESGFELDQVQVLDTPFSMLGNYSISPQFGIRLAAVGDVDGDTVPDLAAFQVQVDAGSFWEFGGILVLLLNEDGTIKEYQRIGLNGSAPWDVGDMVGVGDLDENGTPDLAIVNDQIYLVYLTATGVPLVIESISDEELSKALVRSEVVLGASLGVWNGMGSLGAPLNFFASDVTTGTWVGIEAEELGQFQGFRSYTGAELGVPAALSGAGIGPIVSAGDLDQDGLGELLVGSPASHRAFVVHPSVACGPRLLRDCNGNVADGCETAVDTDEACGGCRRSCLGRPNASGGSCDDGDCLLECALGFLDCNGRPEDGCELAEDGAAYPNAAATACDSGSPSLTCDSGFEDCDGFFENGCEVATDTDVANCGACGSVCEPDPATGYTPLCDGGNCGSDPGSCSSAYGYVDCPVGCCCGFEDTLCPSGEECHLIEIHQDLSSPTFGICEATCPDGTGDCDGNPDNGCETDLTTRSNCGSCGNTCPIWDWRYYCVPEDTFPVTYDCKTLK